MVQEKIIKAFHFYNDNGFKTLPTKEDKMPVKGISWKGGINDEKLYNLHGIAVLCGKDSDNLMCIDFDNHFGDAKDTLSKFMTGEVKEIYDRYKLPIESTVSGGFHLFFRCNNPINNKKLARRPIKNGDGKWRPDAIIETRGEGGYVVVNPTDGYKLIRGSMSDIQYISDEECNIIIETAKSFDEWNDSRPTEYENDDKPGDVFNSKVEAIDEMKSSLKRAGWEEVTIGRWRRPDKKTGISATLGKVAPNVFYNFSANGYPFDENKAYTPFQVISLLDYNGDFSAFAKEIVDRYDLNNKPKQINKENPSEPTTNELDEILKNALIDLEIPVERPPVIMKVKQYYLSGVERVEHYTRLFTLGNFSAITGKSKSKKTFLTTLLLASASSNSIIDDKIASYLPSKKTAVLLFDTEQSRYDSYVSSKRVADLLGYIPSNFGAFDLREFTPIERCKIIEYGISKLKDNIGFVVIDGIADLANAINDEEEATRVVSLLMKWTKVYNCHIVTVIHQNKNDEYATGHLGSSILKKAECIISVKKDSAEFNVSHVKCDLIRGAPDFDDFSFSINEDGLPVIDQSLSYKIKQTDAF